MPTESLGAPVKLLCEAEGHIVTVSTDDGASYRGYLVSMEDTMNCKLRNVVATDPQGQRSAVQEVFIRGTSVHHIVLPELFEYAPILRSRQQIGAPAADQPVRGRGRARGGGRS